MKTKTETKAKEKSKTAGAGKVECNDRDCPQHGRLSARGRSFQGKVIRKFSRRLTIEFERMVYFKKYERYARFKTKIHARIPKCMQDKIQVGDIVRIQECRPLSKLIHFVVVGKVNNKKSEKKE